MKRPISLQVILSIFIVHLCLGVTAQTNITYQPSTEDFPNPERGFYRYSETRSENYTPLNLATLLSFRQNQTSSGATYQVNSTLVFRYFFLKDFTSSNISQAYLTAVQADFDIARQAGVKLIPRFAYTDEVNDTGCGSFICPPYGDAAKSWVLTHIAQLAPVLQANEDVIAAVQMGLIGTWGENYYTDFFGDASQGPDFKLVDANWNDRIDVLEALLGAVPASRSVQVRYPQMKQRTVYGINAPTTSAALVLAEAYTGSDKARIGFHNDCLLASPADFGTYNDYGNTATSSSEDTTNLRPYAAADGQFVPVGGETCSDGYSPENDCASSDPSAYGDAELRRFHYSYLNADYNNDVNNDWQTGGCMDDIKRSLGYRFELQSGSYTSTVSPGQIIGIDIDLLNKGYAAPFNGRDVALVLRNTNTGDVFTAALSDDPRNWFGGTAVHNITTSVCVPAGMPTGNYEMLLHLPDPISSIRNRPEYAIRLANTLSGGGDVWEPTTGYNSLGHTLTIDQSSSNAACNGESTFSAAAGPLPVTLISFMAEAQTNDILVTWETASETNNEGFGVERSTNGIDFSQLTFTNSLGSPTGGAAYDYLDENIVPGVTYYYRLAQRDNDGTITLSNTVSATVSTSGTEDSLTSSFSISPNPTIDILALTWITPPVGKVQLSLFDALGRLVLLTTNSDYINLANLPSGVYELRVEVNESFVVKRVLRK